MISPTSIQTFSGIFFDPFHPDPESIRIEDIAHSLGLQCRFTGHVRRRWSVAQHSLMVADLCPSEHRLCGLLHDATEAYLVDLPRPIKRHADFFGYRDVERRVWEAIAVRFDLPVEIPQDVHIADNIMLWVEADALLHGTADWPEDRPGVLPSIYSELVAYIGTCGKRDDEMIRDMFLDAFREFSR